MQSAANKPLFTILIPTWNNLPYLKLCVESILKHSAFPHQIVLHINEGTDGTLDWAKNHLSLTYTHSKENIGICHALNKAAEKATTDYICYFNDDMYALTNWDKALFQQIQQADSELFFFSATMLEPFEGKNLCAIGSQNYGNTPETFREEALLENFRKPHKADWNGASWPPNVVHRKVWERVGGYSVEFSPGLYSDPDFSRKLWEVGVRDFRGVADSRVYHFGSKSLKRITMNNGRKTFKQKWGISPGFFDKHYLRKGTTWQGKLPEAPRNIAFYLNRLRTLLGF